MMKPPLHITADKRLRYAPPKFVSQTSFIRKTLAEIKQKAGSLLEEVTIIS